MKYIVALDVGTTTIRCHVLDSNAVTIASATEKVELLYPKPAHVEINPDQLWMSIIKVLKNAVHASKVDVKLIACLGISTQRSSFISWDFETGKYYHRIITWKDLRADSMVREWNSSLTMKSLRMGSHILYTLSRNKRFLAGSVLKLMNTQMTLRLMWALQNIPGLQEAAQSGSAVFGGVDCWLLYKLTGKHITDVSSASATGLYDPFTMTWAQWAMNLFKIPSAMFPRVVDTAGDFGTVPKDIFGVSIPITCCMADQAASLFGSTCFNPGDLKVTMGTGSFLNVNTGTEPHASVAGLYPLVAWKINSEIVYMAEGASSDTGTAIEWIKSLGIINEPREMSDLANSVDSSDIYFVPAFSGLQAPINDQSAATGFLGLRPTSGRPHIVRSVLEGLVFRILLLYESLCTETCRNYNSIRVDGGVSQNDFMLQLLSDLTGLPVERSANPEMSILGVAFLSGLQCGIWENRQELCKLRQVDKVFQPDIKRASNYLSVVSQWKRAVQRFKNWY
ncbi:putative glycerol kinase 5 [Microplitis mediator]|uniref:putative glycerol kinase 5 n=1 Tax=Microplitis mediator TaxID=375433 RepID=UPI002555C2D3|nr:putative glycerol kinase 5 [Microplitis mediator]